MEERLQKYLANSGIASRRKCEELILQGKIQVNGKVVTELGTKINPEKDNIKFDGKEVRMANRLVYILLNKPIGYVTTVDDQFGRDTVLDLVKVKERIVPVGRLDMYTSGALILTNDGDFVYKVTHPKHEITKTYTVTVRGIIENEAVEKLKNGVEIVDTPGFSTLDINFIEKEDLKYCFPEFEDLNNQCKFRGCMHYKEPNCAIKEAVEEGKINKYRYEFYVRTLEEILDGRKYK